MIMTQHKIPSKYKTLIKKYIKMQYINLIENVMMCLVAYEYK